MLVSNTNEIQQFQNIALRGMTNAPSFISNHSLHVDLSMITVAELTGRFYKSFHNRLRAHHNLLIQNTTQPKLYLIIHLDA